MSRRNTFFIPVAFTPASLTNLKLWVKSDTGITLVGSKVSAWADQSGNGNNLTQGTDANRPTFVSSQLNGYGTVQFDGINDKMVSPSFTLAQPETIFIVYKNPSFDAGGYIFDGITGDSGGYFQYGSSPFVYMYAGASFTPITGIAGAYFLATCIFNGASSKHQRNNAAEQTGNAGAASMGGFTLGSYAGGTGYEGNPHVAEVVVMSGVATAAQRNNMKTYVTNRYGITM
jgi:hypothetical protein